MFSEIAVDEDREVGLGMRFPRVECDGGAALVRRKDRGLHLRLSWTCGRDIPTAVLAMTPGVGDRRIRGRHRTLGAGRSEGTLVRVSVSWHPL